MAQYVYSMHRVGKVVPPKRHILKNISLSFFPGAKIGVLGLNGSGKSTLLRIMAGIDTDIEGEARPQPGIKIGYLPQEPKLNLEQTVRESVEEAVGEVKRALTRLDEVYALYADPEADFDKLAKEQGELEAIIQSHDGHNLDNQLERAADALRLPPWDAKIANLSGGERRRVAICRLLLEKPDMLLLDEPTNHRMPNPWLGWSASCMITKAQWSPSPMTVTSLITLRVGFWNLTVVRVFHGKVTTPHGWSKKMPVWRWKPLLKPHVVNLLRKSWSGFVRIRKAVRQKVKLVWLALKSLTALNIKNVMKPASCSSHRPRLGDKVLEVEHLSKSYGDRVLIDDLTFALPKGAIVGIIGPNGAGKSTLFRMLSGQEQPDSGTISLGDTVLLASVDQFRDNMDDSKTVWEEVSGGQDIMKIGNFEIPSRAYVGRFNFKGIDQGKRVGELSGGERGRIHLAKLLQVGGNMLLLDEPTNDLDIETLRALENALLEFPGCAMVISHDRWFLDRIATHIIDYQDEGKVAFFEGNFTEYEEWKKRTLGAEALEPHRIKYKKMTK